MFGVRKDQRLCVAEVCACAGRREVECTVKNVPPSNTDGAHHVGPRGLLRKTGGSQGTFSSIDWPIRSASYAQLARQSLALCALGVQPKMRPCVYGCRQPRQRGVAAYPQLAGTLKSPMTTCGRATRSQLRASARGAVKVLIPLMMGTPWVGRCTWAQGVGRACARGRQTCFEEGDTIYFE